MSLLRLIAMAAAGLLVTAGAAVAQDADAEVRPLVDGIDRGRSEEARAALPDLVARHQSHPAVIYLQGRLASDGVEAAKFYQSVVDNFPKSAWADDALFALYQYYYALGLYRTADIKLQQLKKEYPDSPLASGRPPTAPAKGDAPILTVPPAKETAVDTAAPEPAASAEPAPAGQFTLQVGAFSTMKNAEKQREFFDDLGIDVEVTNKVRGGRSLYLVWVGRFATALEAKEFGKSVKAKYKIDSIVVERY